MQNVAVVDFGTGNLRSVHKALEHVTDGHVEVTRDAGRIVAADRVVLPGQGAMGSWLSAMQDFGLRDAIEEVLATRPVLGICLGLQALTRHSDEDGGVDGLGFFDGVCKRFSPDPAVDGVAQKVPHMGWNQVSQKAHTLWHGIDDMTRFYFVHSYFAELAGPEDVAGTTNYINEFVCAAARDNVFAVQFHPEKSHHQGLILLKNFVNWPGE